MTTIRTRPKPVCLLCGSPGILRYTVLKDRLHSAPGLWQLKQCSRAGCGLYWSDPAPLEEDLPLAYINYQTHAVTAGVAARLAHLVLSKAYWTAIRIPALLTGLQAERNEILTMYLGKSRPGLLDVGCGDGQFLSEMLKLGWKGSGIDFDAAAVENGRKKYGLDLAVGEFMSAEYPERGFDAVTMSHVIEHVPDPIACLEKCRRLLPPGGRLVVTTPNTGSLGHQRFKDCWRGLEPPRHLHIFTPGLLAECARRAGLRVVRSGSTAANADYVANAGLSMQNAPPDAPGIGGGWNVRYAFPAILFQYQEHFALKDNPDVGEEAFLICERPQ